MGPNGTGKTSLFRTLSGIWSPTKGTIVVPKSMYVMPQRPFFCWRACLWEQVAYPRNHTPKNTPKDTPKNIHKNILKTSAGNKDTAERRFSAYFGDGTKMPSSTDSTDSTDSTESATSPLEHETVRSTKEEEEDVDQEMRSIAYWLKLVGLEDVVLARGLYCGRDSDFTTSLSGGQQQRVMWARMLYNVTKQPMAEECDPQYMGDSNLTYLGARFVLLDEATSAISSDWVKRLYDVAKRHGITLVSIAHSKEVEEYHKTVVRLSEGGGWAVERR